MKRNIAGRKLGLCIAAAVGLGVVALGTLAAVAAPVAAPTTQVDPAESLCTLDGRQTIRPEVLLPGQTTEVMIHVRATCPRLVEVAHTVLVLDSSNTLSDAARAEMRSLAEQTIQLFAGKPNGYWNIVSIVSFNGQSRVLCEIEVDSARLLACLDQLSTGAGSRLDRGLQAALDVLPRGRDFRPPLEPGEVLKGNPGTEVIMVFSGGHDSADCAAANGLARSVKQAGAVLFSVCLGDNCDATCMRSLASSGRYYFTAAAFKGFLDRWQPCRDCGGSIPINVRRTDITTHLTVAADYVADSAEPQTVLSPDARRLTWRENFMPLDGLAMTYLIRPSGIGALAVTTETVVTMRDTMDRTRQLRLPPSSVLVLNAPVFLPHLLSGD